MDYQIFNKFKNIVERDSNLINKINSSWAYQDNRSKKLIYYNDDTVNDFNNYSGPEELLKWFNWLRNESSNTFLPDDIINPIIKILEKKDKQILQKLGCTNIIDYKNNIGINSASDYIFQNAYLTPQRRQVKNILDFGAGYGRQALMWTEKPDILYCGWLSSGTHASGWRSTIRQSSWQWAPGTASSRYLRSARQLRR